jgi:hypothetical protein
MKTFKSLKFKPHAMAEQARKEAPENTNSVLEKYKDNVQALMFFKNGYGISVVGGYGLYGDGKTTFEAAVMRGTRKGCSICYDTYITDDVLGYLSKDDITKTMEQIQRLPSI